MRITPAALSLSLALALAACTEDPIDPPPPVDCTATPRPASCPPVDCTVTPRPAECPPIDCTQTPRPAECPPIDCTQTPRPAECPPVDCTVTPRPPECPPIDCTQRPRPAECPPVDCTQTPEDPECPPVNDCARQPPLPVEGTLWLGDAHAARELPHDAQLVRDADDNLVGVDRSGDVFRVNHDGQRTVIAARAVRAARGVVYLASGELVIADGGLGRLVAVYPSGEVRTVIPHLDLPSGLAVDAHDGVLVAEQMRRAIRRVDVRARTSSVVADRLAFAPSALALSPDGATLYATDEEEGAVYALPRQADGSYGPAVPWIRGEVSGGPCRDRHAGDACVREGRVGSCELDAGNGQLVCELREPCADRREGDNCRGDFFEIGTCVGAPPFSACEPPEPCANAPRGARCLAGDRAGHCVGPAGAQVCEPLGACAGLLPGDACQEPGGIRGVCTVVPGAGDLVCGGFGDDCFGRNPGESCRDGSGFDGTCTADGVGNTFCFATDPCQEGAQPGDACTRWGMMGQCAQDMFGWLSCTPGGATVSCAALAEGDACVELGAAGTCVDDFRGGVYCQTAAACVGASVGDVCRDPAAAGSGRCAKTSDGRAYCASTRPCAGVAVGERCYAPYAPGGGLCTAGPRSTYCASPGEAGPCEGQLPGASCTAPDGGTGTCVDLGGTLSCETPACSDGVVGALCSAPGTGDQGHCYADDGALACMAAAPCDRLQAGARCTTASGAGTCAADGRGGLECRRPATCEGAAAGDACVNKDGGQPGRCAARAGGRLLCEVASPCDGKAEGEGCSGRAGVGACVAGVSGGALTCQPRLPGLAPKALETDACGWLYVADARSGEVRRYSPDGGESQVVARTGYAAITSLTWGGRAGGWRERALYLGVRGGNAVVELPLDVTPRAVVKPAATPVAGPDSPPAVDCLALSPAPIAVNELRRPRGYHDVAFTDDGELVGSDGSALVAVDRQDQLRVHALVAGAEGIDRLADGTLIVASPEGLVRVSPEGAVSPLAPGIQAYGVTVGPDGMVYAGTNGTLYRVDPATGAVTTYLDPERLPRPFAARTINFDVDHSLMYVGAFGDSVYVFPIDENLDPRGPPRRLLTIRGAGPFFDGLGVDACGNVYVPSYSHSALYRFSPDGEGALYWDPELTHYGHGIRFGPAAGTGGWRADAAYLPQPYDNQTVVEVVTGVGGRP